MEESFRVRVDKVFGSLAFSKSSSSPAPSSSLTSQWCLTDEEKERREWNRERDSPDLDHLQPQPYPSNNRQNRPTRIEDLSEADELEDLSDFEESEDDGNQRSSRQLLRQPDDLEFDIRSSIGLDPTLDYEDEEDEFDKVAVGREEAGDRLYMSDITDYGTDINSHNELPDTFKDVTRDPRANHSAAKIRLKEDAEAASNFGFPRSSECIGRPAVDTNNSETSEDVVHLKSILKRRENQMDPKSQKRVRFDPGCTNDCEEKSEGAKDLALETCSMEKPRVPVGASSLPQYSSGVPDYIQNPSKYTHYTFDSSCDVDEESNRKAYIDFLNLMKRSNTSESQPDDTSIDLPTSVTFTPKKKLGDSSMVKSRTESKQNSESACKESMHKKGWPISIASGCAEESEVCAMEEDEAETAANKSRKSGRQYRAKANMELDETAS
ncbi:uncharacterized protein LOC132315603 [Cornus florida]|uniref:uncharacterized protein LOC132315603 n=1 Tax=Cornus florida TaxID=4283 RepID=UPI00289D182A|nr:uncharacterized protein LOC132315603 [Cornus florida]